LTAIRQQRERFSLLIAKARGATCVDLSAAGGGDAL
jgi:hypothetical protein